MGAVDLSLYFNNKQKKQKTKSKKQNGLIKLEQFIWLFTLTIKWMENRHGKDVWLSITDKDILDRFRVEWWV